MMDNNKHLTILSILLIATGTIASLIAICFFVGFPIIGKFVGDSLVHTALTYMGTGIGSIILIISTPAIIAGIGLIYRKKWSRILSLIICVLKLFNLPFGTALGIYGIWVLMQDENIEVLNK